VVDYTKIFGLLLGSIASFFVFVFYLNRFFNREKIPSLLRSLSFFLFFLASSVGLLIGSSNTFSLPLATVGMVVLYSSLVLDEHSRLRYSLPIPFLALFFIDSHKLLLVESLLAGIALMELSYNNEHKRLIPFVVVLTLVVIAEYFTVYKDLLKVSEIGINFLYIIASLILLLWILFYLIRELIRLLKNED